jgi:competence protein ComEC
MVAGTLLFVAGVVSLQLQSELPATGWAACLPLLLVARRRFSLLRYALFFLCGFFWALIYAKGILSSQLAEHLEQIDLLAEGVIVSLPEKRERSSRFLFRIDKLSLDGEEVEAPSLVRLAWYGSAPQLVAGEKWRLQVRLKRPHGFMNGAGFDYEGWLFRNGIRATGYVRQSEHNALVGAEGFPVGLLRWRQEIRALIYRLIPQQQAALVVALTIGDRSGIEREEWDALARTGTSHLFAISGLHIGIVAGLCYLLLFRGWRRCGRLALRLPAQHAGAIGALVSATGYAALAGFALPTQRALIMLLVFFGAQLLRRAQRPFHSLLLALAVVVVLDPCSVLSAGFWLSFGAVGAILYGMTGRLKTSGLFWKWGRVQWLVSLGLAPVLVAWQLQVSLAAPLVNLVAVPLFSLLIVPLALAGTLLAAILEAAGQPLLLAAGWMLEECLDLMGTLSRIPRVAWSRPLLPSWVWMPVTVGVLLLLMPRGLPARWLGLFFVSPLVLLQPAVPPPGAVWLTLLDVGDGLAAVIRTAEHTLIYDTGPRFSSSFDAGSAVVVPFLRGEGVRSVDRIILSHGDMDHRGGLAAVVAGFEVKSVISGEPNRITHHRSVKGCAEVDTWQWDGVVFEILHPRPGRIWKGNNVSCMLRISNAAGSILLPGDIEKKAERYLVARRPELLDADVVIAPHHGSNSSSSAGFVAAVTPRYVLVSTGYRNRYGFPKAPVVQRWQGVSAEVITTAESGAVEIRLQRDGLLSAPRRYRVLHQRYWTDFSEGPGSGH